MMKKLLTFLMLLVFCSSVYATKVVIAVDAGHGGKDSGAIGQSNLYEKTVTFSIAKKLTNLLNKDPSFKGVLTRSNDTFISVPQRSDIARKNKANLLVSIHADAAPNRNATGASVWVLSTKRADTELGRWLEQDEKKSQLLGGAGDVLADDNNRHLNQAVLDLQFSYSQRVGYELATQVLKSIKSVTNLHKNLPEHASLGVLRSPDIPSILIEVGFISNQEEERLLSSNTHQDKIAKAIYQGIKNYVKQNPKFGEQH